MRFTYLAAAITMLGVGNMTCSAAVFIEDSAYSSFAAACSAAVSANLTLAVETSWTNVSTMSCGADLFFDVLGRIQPAASGTVTLTGTITAPADQQIFDVSNTGATIAFPFPLPSISPVWWGADPSGTNDSTIAFNAAFAAVGNSGSGGTLLAPVGIYKISGTLTTPSTKGMIFSGSGSGTVLTWNGTTGIPMLLIPNCQYCRFQDFQVQVSATKTLTTAIQTENNGGGGYVPSGDVFESIFINGSAGNVGTCFLIDGPTDANNDQQRFTDDHCSGYSSAAWTLGDATLGFNIANVLIEHSTFLGGGYGQYGVWVRHGGFHWTDGDGAGNYGCDFRFDTVSAFGYRIENGEFENSKQFICTNGAGQEAGTVKISNVTWDGACLGNSQAQIKMNCPSGPAAGDMISWGYLGPLDIESSIIGVSTAGNTMTPGVAATIGLSYPPGPYPGVTFENDLFGTSATSTTTLFSSNLPERFFNNSEITTTGAPFRLAPQFVSQSTYAVPPSPNQLQAIAQVHWFSTSTAISIGAGPQTVASDGVSEWVTNGGGSTVSQITASTGVVANTYSTGTSTGPIGVITLGGYVWIANYSSNTAIKMAASSGTIVNTVSVGSNPVGICTDGTNIWVTNSGSGTITEITASSASVVGTYTVGSNPAGCVFDGTNIWVANNGSGTVSELLASTGALEKTITAGTNPNGIAYDGQGHIWVANRGSSSVMEISVGLQAVIQTVSVGANPSYLAFDGISMWVTNSGDSTIDGINVTSGAVQGPYAVGTYPTGIAYDGYGNLFTANSTASTATKISIPQ